MESFKGTIIFFIVLALFGFFFYFVANYFVSEVKPSQKTSPIKEFLK